MATLGLNAQDKQAFDTFKRDVIDRSMTNLVVLYFTASWCGPCKALGPVIDKVTAAQADKGVILAKYDVDTHGAIAAQFQIRSVPTVYAVFQGQIVADLTPARSEGQLTRILEQLLKQLPIKGEAQSLEAEIEPLLEMGEEVLAGGDGERAAGIFSQILEIAPENTAALAGLVRALVAAGRVAEAEGMLAGAPADPAIDRARAAVELAKSAKPSSELQALADAVNAAPEDHAKRFELATAQMGVGDHDGAADQLLHIIRADKDWQEGAARTQLLKLFEVVGLMDPWVKEQRRRLSAALFG